MRKAENLGAKLIIKAAKERGIRVDSNIDDWPNPVWIWKKDANGPLHRGLVESIEDARLVIDRFLDHGRLNSSLGHLLKMPRAIELPRFMNWLWYIIAPGRFRANKERWRYFWFL